MMSTVTMKGVAIPVGQSKTIDIALFSDGDTNGPWQVEAYDTDMLLGNAQSLSFSFDKTSGQNGDILHLTINVIQQGTSGVETFVLYSTLGTQVSEWVGLVAN
jgi:hypothetical protein